MPLLATVALGALMSGAGRWIKAFSGTVLLGLTIALGITLRLPSANLDRLDLVFLIGWVALGGVAAVWVGIAVWGWVRYFRGRPATA
ncbi:MAG: hypothetical protein JWO31_1907 [Phycisphaerales bacterium]|nr:hypothetical protein [Phycisphaerales bacterium]